MTTTTPSTSTVSTAPVAAAKNKRPRVLVAAAVLMLLAAVLSLATPFLPRGGGGPGGQTPPAGAPTGGQPPAGQNFTPGQDGAPSGAPSGARTGMPGQGGAFGMMSFMQPLRIGEAVLGGLLALFAALGLWRLKTWGRNLVLVVAAGSLITAVATFVSPLLGRGTPWLMVLTSSTWQAIAGLGLALVAALLALLPAARQAYFVKPRERRVM